MKDYKLTITIDGDSAKELFAIGPNDLRDYFLPEYLNVNPDDVVKITFLEDLSAEELLFSDVSIHSDNYYRNRIENE